jgi:DNA-binding NtrC family response regulator
MTTANPAKRILVVANDEAMGEIFPAMLRAAGYECDAVWEHKAILRMLKRVKKFDLLLCQMAALEKEEKLLAWILGVGKDTPLVVAAGRSWPEIPKVIQKRCSYLQMPFARDQLLSNVQETLDGHPLRLDSAEVAACYFLRIYVTSTLASLNISQWNKVTPARKKRAIADATGSARAAVEIVEKLFQSLRSKADS